MFDHTGAVAQDAMAQAFGLRLYDKVIAVAESWTEARGVLPTLPTLWYAESLTATGRPADASAVLGGLGLLSVGELEQRVAAELDEALGQMADTLDTLPPV
jgi:hypothetical protein